MRPAVLTSLGVSKPERASLCRAPAGSGAAPFCSGGRTESRVGEGLSPGKQPRKQQSPPCTAEQEGTLALWVLPLTCFQAGRMRVTPASPLAAAKPAPRPVSRRLQALVRFLTRPGPGGQERPGQALLFR